MRKLLLIILLLNTYSYAQDCCIGSNETWGEGVNVWTSAGNTWTDNEWTSANNTWTYNTWTSENTWISDNTWDSSNNICSDTMWWDEASCEAAGTCSNPAFNNDQTSCLLIGTCSDSTFNNIEAACLATGICDNPAHNSQADCESEGTCTDENHNNDQSGCEEAGGGVCSNHALNDNESGCLSEGSCSNSAYSNDEAGCMQAEGCSDAMSPNEETCCVNNGGVFTTGPYCEGSPYTGQINFSYVDIEAIGGGLYRIPLSVQIEDIYGSPVADSTSVYIWVEGHKPHWCSAENVADEENFPGLENEDCTFALGDTVKWGTTDDLGNPIVIDSLLYVLANPLPANGFGQPYLEDVNMQPGGTAGSLYWEPIPHPGQAVGEAKTGMLAPDGNSYPGIAFSNAYYGTSAMFERVVLKAMTGDLIIDSRNNHNGEPLLLPFQPGTLSTETSLSFFDFSLPPHNPDVGGECDLGPDDTQQITVTGTLTDYYQYGVGNGRLLLSAPGATILQACNPSDTNGNGYVGFCDGANQNSCSDCFYAGGNWVFDDNDDPSICITSNQGQCSFIVEFSEDINIPSGSCDDESSDYVTYDDFQSDISLTLIDPLQVTSPNVIVTILKTENDYGGGISGCMNPEACNYNPEATNDDNSCEYAEENYNCDGECIAEFDCNNDCGGSAVVDDCGVCNGDGAIYECGCSDEQLHCRDLDGDGFGTSEFTYTTCDIEDDIWVINCEDLDDTIYCESNETDCAGILCGDTIFDCSGTCGGSAELDNCDTCDNDASNDCVQDCTGVWGGTAMIDCFGMCDGSAVIDECNVCGGPGAIYECGCADIPDGNCDCNGNIIQNYYADWDGDGFGNCELVYELCPSNIESWMAGDCGDCDNSNADIIVEDCTGVCGGEAIEDECGECNGDGIADGECDCAGNVEDCAGECGGSSEYDECGNCDGDGSLCGVTIPEIPDQIINEDDSLNLNFNVVSSTEAVYDDVILSNISNGNENHILTSLSGDIDNGYNLIITPVDNWNGTFDVQVEIANGASNSDTETFSVTVNPMTDPPELDYYPAQMYVDEDDDAPPSRYLYLYDVDTDSNLNENPDSYAYPGLYDISLDSNDKISAEFNQTNISSTTGRESLRFSYDFKNIDEDWNGTRQFTATYNDQDYSSTTAFDVEVRQVNDAPEIDEGSVSDQNMDEEGSLDVTINASDIDSDATLNENDLFDLNDLVFTCSGNQISCTATDVDGVATLTIVPDADYNKTTTVTVNVSDGELTDDTTFELTINKENDAPELSIPDQDSNENTDFVIASLTTYASDVDADINLNEPAVYDTNNFTYSVQLLSNDTHATATIDGSELTVSPIEDFNGDIEVEITIEDNDPITPGTLTATDTFILSFNKVNDAPEIDENSVSDQNMDEDTSLDVSITATDLDSDPTFNLDQPLFNLDDLVFTCSGNQITCTATDVGGVGTLTIVPDQHYNKTTTVTVVVSDGELSDETTFELTINQIQDEPSLYIVKDDVLINGNPESEILVDEDGNIAAQTPSAFYIYDVDQNSNLNENPDDYEGDDNATYSLNISPNDNLEYTSVGNGVSSNLYDVDNDGTDDPVYYFFYRFENTTEHWNGTEDLIATYGDGISVDQTENFSVTVLQVNDAPEIDDGTVSDQNVDEDSSIDVTITASDIDSDVSLNENDLFNIDDLEFTCSGEQLTCTSTDVGGVATLTIVPDSDYNKTTTVTVTVSDGELTDDATFDLTINSKNDAPILYNNSTDLNEELDDQETDEEQDFVYTIYAEDIDSDVNLNESPYDLANFTYSVTLLTNSDKATTDITNNILTISPNIDFFGDIEVELTVQDNDATDPGAASDVETFILTVNNINDPPSINPITDETIDEDLGLDLGNDPLEPLVVTIVATDPDDDTLTYSATTNRFITSVSDNEITFTPEEHWHGQEIITITVDDGTGEANSSATTSFIIFVNSVNDAPVVEELLEITINEGSDPVDIPLYVINNDYFNEEGETFIYEIDDAALQGTLTYDNASTVTYDPDTDYTGTTSFLYRADDQQVDLSGVLQNNLSNWGEYRIVVQNVNDAPEIEDIGDVTIDEDTSTDGIDLIASDVDVEPLTFTAAFDPSEMVSSYDIQTITDTRAELTITPVDDFNGAINVTVTVTDGNGTAVDNNGDTVPSEDSDSFVLTVNQVNDSPILDEIADITMEEDRVGGLTSAIYIYDVDTHETLNANPEEYTAILNYDIVNNSILDYITATVESQGYATYGETYGGDIVKYVINYNYAPLANFNGTEEFSFTVDDGEVFLDAEIFDVIVTPVNDPPEMVPIDCNVVDCFADEDEGNDGDEIGFLEFQLEATDVDNIEDLNNPPTDQISEFVFSVVDIGLGTAPIDQATDIITIMPADNFNGPMQIEIGVTDGDELSTTILEVEINSVNDAPSIVQEDDYNRNEEETFTLTLESTDIDTNESLNTDEDDPVYDISNITYYQPTLLTNSDKATATIVGDLLTVEPIDDFVGDIEIQIIASDNDNDNPPDTPLDSEPMTFILTFLPVNDKPVLNVLDDETIDEDTSLTYVVSATDVDGDDLTFSYLVAPDYFGTDTEVADIWHSDTGWYSCEFIDAITEIDNVSATFSITPCEHWNRDILVTITVTDGYNTYQDENGNIIDGTSEDSDTFTILITPSNDPPESRWEILNCTADNCTRYYEDGITVLQNVETTNVDSTIVIDYLDHIVAYDFDTYDALNKNPDSLEDLTFHIETHPEKDIDNVSTQLGQAVFIDDSSVMEWDPHPNYNGLLTIGYYVSDGIDSSQPDNFQINVLPVNDNVADFNLISAIHNYDENLGVVTTYDSDYYIKFPNFEIDGVTLLLDDINSSNVIEYHEYVDSNSYEEGDVTFKWERSSDIDTHIDLNELPLRLSYRLELVDSLNQKIYIIQDKIYDENWVNAESWCDEGDAVNCIVTTTIDEGPYITYGLNDYTDDIVYDPFWWNDGINDDGVVYETLSIDAQDQYYWRVTAQDYHYIGGWSPVSLISETPLNTYNDTSEDDYYIDFTKPNFDYSFILNNIYNNYFDLYIKANEDIETNDSLFYSYHQLEQISQLSDIDPSYLGGDIYAVYDRFNAYGSVSTYFAGEDLSGNINIDRNDLIFNTVPYNSASSFNSPSGLSRVTLNNNSHSESNILIYEQESHNHGELISDIVTINSNLDFDNSQVMVEFLKDYIDLQYINNLNEIHIVRIFNNSIEVIPTYNNGNSIYAYIDQAGSFGLIHNDFYEQQVIYETKIVSSYPNPFNPIVTLEYTLEKDSYVDINVYNILGQKVRSLYSGDRQKGENNIIWDGKNASGKMVSSGSYFIHILNENNNLIEKVTLMK